MVKFHFANPKPTEKHFLQKIKKKISKFKINRGFGTPELLFQRPWLYFNFLKMDL